MEFRGQFSETVVEDSAAALSHFSDIGSHTKVVLRHPEWNRIVTGEIIDAYFVGTLFDDGDQLLRNDILVKIGTVTIPNYDEDGTDTFVLCRGEDTSSSLYILQLDALVIPVTEWENTPGLRHQNAFRRDDNAPVRVLFQ